MKNLLQWLLPLSLLAGCAGSLESVLPGPYRIDVRQGNFVTQEMVAQLKQGQTRDQVRFILGSPLVTDIFHADRWDYIYRFKSGRSEVQERRLTVFFENNLLARVAGDVVAASETRPLAPRVIEISGPDGVDKAKQEGKTP